MVVFFIPFIDRRERKYLPVYKMSKRMSNTLRKIYKQNNAMCEQGCSPTPENQSSNLTEKAEECPVPKSDLYAEINDNTQEARSIVGAPSKKNNKPVGGNIVSVSPKLISQKKIRHRRLGSADSNYTFILPAKQPDRRNIRMVHMETQTDNLCDEDEDDDIDVVDNNSISNGILPKDDRNDEIKELDIIQNNESSETDIINDNNNEAQPVNNSFSNEQLIYDYMNSNEQLDVRESSDEDNLENLNRRVSQFFTENRIIQSNDNGNGSIIDNRLLQNMISTRRSCISINDKDEVTILSRGNHYRTGSVNATVYTAHSHFDSIRRDNLNYNKSGDHNCNNDDGDDSWTDEEGEESDRSYSLRRKRFVPILFLHKKSISRMIGINFNSSKKKTSLQSHNHLLLISVLPECHAEHERVNHTRLLWLQLLAYLMKKETHQSTVKDILHQVFTQHWKVQSKMSHSL